MRFEGATVLITGGAMGLGKLMAERSINLGATKIVLWDINEAKLAETAQVLQGRAAEIFAYKVDVSDPAMIQSGAQQVLAEAGPVDILFNNAGVVVGKNFVDHTHADIDKTVEINVAGVMHVALAFLPSMTERKKGHLVNISSASGLLPVPRASVYAASKWAVLGWSETLRIELQNEHPDLRVTTVCPSYITTGMFEGARAPMLTPLLAPEVAVNAITTAVTHDKILVRMPWIVNTLPLFRGMMTARMFDLLAGKIMGVYTSMEKFVGHGAPAKS